MSDLISRQAAIEAVEESRRLNHHQDGKGACAHEYEHRHFLKLLIDLPPAQPERKQGKWLADNRPGGGFWVCSCCKFPSEAFAANVLYKFCPNCGADMRGEQNE